MRFINQIILNLHSDKSNGEETYKIHLGRDILTGIVVALVSIPISMGYAQIAGLPVVYGLYASILPILVFGFLTTSPQFVVGVDAMPAAMVGGLLTTLGFTAESEEAMQLAPLMAVFTAVWFLIFYAIKAGRVVKYISMPVMSGFISGVGLTIILIQIPKLFGGTPGSGEVLQLLETIWRERSSFHWLSFGLGVGTIVIILVCKRIIPKIPMTAIMLVIGGILQIVFHLDEFGVKLLPEVSSGMPKFCFPSYSAFSGHLPDLVIQSASIAAVIMAQTLLASGNYAMKHGDKLNNNAELLAYSAMNMASALVGGCPINGSVSRSAIADSMGCRSQVMSITAAITMLCLVFFGASFLSYLPVPVLTGIVVTALIGILDIKAERRLWKTNRNEWIVFMVAFLGVLIFGTVNGVLIGVVLSFGEVAIKGVTPPVSFVGRIPGQGNFYALDRNRNARPIKHTLVYRFSGNLFFANIDKFQNDIEGAIKKDTKQIVVDARGIGSVDITAVDRLLQMNRNLRDRGIKFYITEHDGSLNDQIRKLQGEELVETGALRRTITLALRDAGLEKPYELEGTPGSVIIPMEAEEKLSEFEWLFGESAHAKMEQMASEMLEELTKPGADIKAFEEKTLDGHGVVTDWGMIGLFDENGFLDFLEIKLKELTDLGDISPLLSAEIEEHIEHRRTKGQHKLMALNPKAIELLMDHRHEIADYIQKNHPKEYEKLRELREKYKQEP